VSATPPVPVIDLGPATGALLASLGVPVRAAVALPGLRSAASPRCSYRLDLADGRQVKLRRSMSAARARGYTLLIRDVADPRLTGVLVCRLDLTLEEWVPGASLETVAIRDEHVAAGAGLLGSLHAIERIGTRPLRRTVPTRPVRAALEADLRSLREAGAIDEGQVRRLQAAAARHDPGVAGAGVIHKDLCPENLVIDPQGIVRAVDNEWMTIGPTGFDLARTWYRWPMPEPAWRHYLSTYACLYDPEPALAHFTFWRIAVVSKSARVRVTLRTGGADIPLRCLASLAAET
jgi:hypothetical protein